MRRALGTVVTLALLAAVVSTVGCGPSEDEKKAQAEAAIDARVSDLRQAREQLTAKRAELAAALTRQAELARTPDADPAAVSELASQVQTLQTEVDVKADELGKQLVDLLNEDPMIEGEPPTARQQELVRMKSDEDILLAREYITQGGDYRGAIEMYNRALLIDPDYQALKDELAKAEADRYMTKERFDQVQKGMTEADVRSLLGQVNAYNIKEYPEKNVIAWFYPREGGAAAGVFFQKNKNEIYVVYQLNFEAVKARDEGGGGAEEPPAG